ncbi:universal stress protein [Halocatena pleomorpha]|uniref:Universal stress protein n=1 Tax=Halocatena pleomorpha TaxID=1785090 RepID=A0A3P3RLN8_9EURY|nr:universal stress protein [Halocatena pleomorpha]RRJ33770.1 universal stress protein [Halocatena pleomorpha]
MSRNILVPIDSSEQSREALEYALTEHAEDDITVIHVLDPVQQHAYGGIEGGGMVSYEAIQEQRQQEAQQLLAEATERADAHNVGIDTEIQTGSTKRAIVAYADDHGMDHIVIGSHGRSGASRILLGSVAETVARRSSVPVTIVR